MPLLRHPHGPADDDALAAQDLVPDRLDLFSGEAGGGEDVLPGDVSGVLGELLEAAGIGADEVVVEHGARSGVLCLQQEPVQTLEQCEVAAATDLKETIGDLDTAADYAVRLLGVLEPQQSGLRQGIHRDDAGTVSLGLLQRGELPWMVGAGILPHQEDQVGVVDVLQTHRAFAGAQALVQGGATGLMAHVAAVGQVVGAEGPGEELQEKSGLIADPARRVEDRLIGRVQCLQLFGQQSQGVVPADRLVVIRIGPLDHRLGEPALLIEPQIGPPAQFGDRVPAEEAGSDAP